MESSPYLLLTTDDVIRLLFLIVFFACLVAIVVRILVFVPGLLTSVLRSVRNSSLIYDDNYLDNSTIHDSKIASSDFGSKTLVDRVNDNVNIH
ncbi:hypothetical protein A5N86_16650 [Geobacillus thermoleovorans]|nr:hypothetical protein A5N86_16650 [Geobacillus thermoleovorans]